MIPYKKIEYLQNKYKHIFVKLLYTAQLNSEFHNNYNNKIL